LYRNDAEAIKVRVDPQLDTLLRFIVGITLAVTLLIIIVAVLYSLIFVTQPIDAQAPNDAEFFKLINPIATFLVGTLSGIMIGTKHSKDNE
jgi:hypothetical protein